MRLFSLSWLKTGVHRESWRCRGCQDDFPYGSTTKHWEFVPTPRLNAGKSGILSKILMGFTEVLLCQESGANLKSKAQGYLWNKNEAVYELCQLWSLKWGVDETLSTIYPLWGHSSPDPLECHYCDYHEVISLDDKLPEVWDPLWNLIFWCLRNIPDKLQSPGGSLEAPHKIGIIPMMS